MRRRNLGSPSRSLTSSTGETETLCASTATGHRARSGSRATATHLAKKVVLGVLYFVTRRLFALLHSLFEARPELVVFGSRAAREFSDNSMHLFRWCVTQESSIINPVWITRSRRVSKELRAAGLPVLLFPSLGALRAIIVCGTVVVSYRIADVCMLSSMLRPSLRVVHLGHGIPVKRFRASLPEFAREERFVDELRALNEIETSFVASSDFAATFVAEANMAPRHRCAVLGLPRNDALGVGDLRWRDTALDSGRVRVLLAPTWRKGQKGVPSLPVWIDDDRLFGALERSDAELWIRLHPKSVAFEEPRIAQLKEYGARIFDLSPREFPDVNSELSRFDALISDYSSIVADFMLTSRPIGLIAESIGDTQLASRFYYRELMDESFPKLRGLEDVVEFVHQVKSNSLVIEYGRLKALLHQYSGSACARVAGHFGFTAGAHQALE